MAKTKKQKTGFEFASLGDRFKAGIFDYLVPFLLIFTGTLLTIFGGVGAFGIIAGVFVNLLGLAMLIFTNIISLYIWSGFSPGKRREALRVMVIENAETMKLRPVQDGDGGKMVIRGILGWIECWLIIPLLFPILFINSSEHNQRLADRVAGTVVITTTKEQVETFFQAIKEKKSKEEANAIAFKGAKKSTKKKSSSKATTTQKPSRPLSSANVKLFSDLSRYLILFGSLVLLIPPFISILSRLFWTIQRSFYSFGGSGPFGNLTFFSGLSKAFNIIGFLALTAVLTGFVLLTLNHYQEYGLKAILPTAFMAGYWLVSFIVLIVIYTANYLKGFGIGQLYIDGVTTFGSVIGTSTFRLVMNIFSILFLGGTLITYNQLRTDINQDHGLQLGKVFSHLTLFIAFGLFILIVIIGGATYQYNNPNIITVVMYYLYVLVLILLTIAYMVVFGGLALRISKYRLSPATD
jgi:uncharacterized RDD family membrane protein YckC